MAGSYSNIQHKTHTNFRWISIGWTSDAAGNVSLTDSAAKSAGVPILDGQLLRLVTIPDGTDVPTDQYDLTFLDEYGIDLLNGNGANRSSTLSEDILVNDTIIVDSICRPTIANAGDAKKGVVKIYYLRNL